MGTDTTMSTKSRWRQIESEFVLSHLRRERLNANSRGDRAISRNEQIEKSYLYQQWEAQA
jgi:hypothetical protein